MQVIINDSSLMLWSDHHHLTLQLCLPHTRRGRSHMCPYNTDTHRMREWETRRERQRENTGQDIILLSPVRLMTPKHWWCCRAACSTHTTEYMSSHHKMLMVRVSIRYLWCWPIKLWWGLSMYLTLIYNIFFLVYKQYCSLFFQTNSKQNRKRS